MSSYLFSSESVSEGHPDKLADQISDTILDALLEQDPYAKVACETYIKTGFVLVGGEISTKACIDIESLVREKLVEIGYTDASLGLDGRSCAIFNLIGKQSADIRQGVERAVPEQQGAGDQGVMFGYATSETPELMPAPILYAHRLMERQSVLRKSKTLPWLRPDAKSQVTFRYEEGKPIAVETVVLSTQHEEGVSNSVLREGIIEELIQPVLGDWICPTTKFLINPTGRFVIGGPAGDCGLTGRKIVVDTYGGAARHGGGAFSGKDASKVDRSAAYMARYIAKHIVQAGLATRCELQLSYAIGHAHPVSISVETFGTSQWSSERLVDLIQAEFDLTPYGIIRQLDLLRPIYRQTAVYGHFGRSQFSWEQLPRLQCLLATG